MLRVDTTEASQERLLTEKQPLPSEMYVQLAFPGILTRLDMIALYVVILFFITNVANAVAAGAAGLALWAFGGICFLIPCAIATAQLAVISPHEGGLYSWTHKLFGGYMSFFVGFCAWFPGPLLVLATADLIVTYIQGLNQAWLVAPWQQGVALLVIIGLSYTVALQRQRMVQNLANYAFFLCLAIVALVLTAGLVRFPVGHPSATSFTHISDWNPFTGANIPLFGVITLGYLGVNLPLNMGNELIATTEQGKRRVITSHLFWGTLIVLVCYLLATIGVLLVQGQNASYNLFSMVTTVGSALGTGAADVAAICIMATLFIATAVYNSVYARFLLVGGIDQRVPVRLGKLNRNRAPSSALLFQAIASGILIVLFFIIAPYTGLFGSNPASLAASVYFIGVGVATLVWAFGTIFLFLNLLRLITRHKESLRLHRIFPTPVLVISAIVGLISGVLAIIDTTLNSYDPPLISNSVWGYLVGFLTIIFLTIAAIAGMFGHSEASWETMQGTLDTTREKQG